MSTLIFLLAAGIDAAVVPVSFFDFLSVVAEIVVVINNADLSEVGHFLLLVKNLHCGLNSLRDFFGLIHFVNVFMEKIEVSFLNFRTVYCFL